MAAPVINPRLTDGFGLLLTQDEVDFAIPHLREDIPLYSGRRTIPEPVDKVVGSGWW